MQHVSEFLQTVACFLFFFIIWCDYWLDILLVPGSFLLYLVNWWIWAFYKFQCSSWVTYSWDWITVQVLASLPYFILWFLFISLKILIPISKPHFEYFAWDFNSFLIFPLGNWGVLSFIWFECLSVSQLSFAI